MQSRETLQLAMAVGGTKVAVPRSARKGWATVRPSVWACRRLVAEIRAVDETMGDNDCSSDGWTVGCVQASSAWSDGSQRPIEALWRIPAWKVEAETWPKAPRRGGQAQGRAR